MSELRFLKSFVFYFMVNLSTDCDLDASFSTQLRTSEIFKMDLSIRLRLVTQTTSIGAC